MPILTRHIQFEYELHSSHDFARETATLLHIVLLQLQVSLFSHAAWWNAGIYKNQGFRGEMISDETLPQLFFINIPRCTSSTHTDTRALRPPSKEVR